LAADAVIRVRAAAWASWCLQSIGDEGFLEREKLWALLREADTEVIAEFFDFLSKFCDGVPFEPSEGILLAELAERVPAIRSQVLWILHEIGGPEVAPFMAQFLNPCTKDRLWCFAYFARCP